MVLQPRSVRRGGWGFTIRWAVMPTGERMPLLTWDGPYGIPDVSVTRYTLSSLRSSRVPNSIELALRGIGVGLAFCAERCIDLTERIAKGTFLMTEETMALHEVMRRGKRVAVVEREVAYDRYRSFIHYVEWLSEPILAGIADAVDRQVALRGLEEFRTRARAAGPKPSRDASLGNPGQRLGMTQEQRELFLRVIRPGAEGNPFRPDLQLRNYAYLLTCYQLGCRAGEMLGLKWADIDFRQRPATISIKRRHDDPDDPRKRAPATKTRARVLYLTDEATAALEAWRHQRADRSRFPGARRHPYVWVGKDGAPLTPHGVSAIYGRLRQKHESLPDNLATHLLRHDWNDRWIELLADGGEAGEDHVGDQIHQMGWSDRTKMTMRYGARARQDRANQRIMRLQRQHKSKENES